MKETNPLFLSINRLPLAPSGSALGASAPAQDLERVTDISPYPWKRLDELHGSIAKAPAEQDSQ